MMRMTPIPSRADAVAHTPIPRRSRMSAGAPIPRRSRLFTVLLAALVVVLGASGCEEAPPNAYTPVPFVTAYLFVDQPITDVQVMMTQPLSEAFSYGGGQIPDARVSIEGGGGTHVLGYRVVDGVGRYELADTSVRVQPETTYTLRVELRDGTVLTGETTTPARFAWVRTPRAVVQYPKDTVTLPTPDSLRIEWTPSNVAEYLVRVRCLDTLGYGAYLTPQTDEVNGRTNNIGQWETPDEPTFYSTTRWGFLQSTVVNTVWSAFRWHGRHEIAILAPDANMLAWFKATQFARNPEYRAQFGSITGGLGVFGSASLVTGDLFLLKRDR